MLRAITWDARSYYKLNQSAIKDEHCINPTLFSRLGETTSLIYKSSQCIHCLLNKAIAVTSLGFSSTVVAHCRYSASPFLLSDCMKILMLAPHPFYQPRGTPIAADLVLRALSERGEHVDIVTFPEGSDKHYPNVTIHRTPAPKIISSVFKGIRPGFSLKKVICDVFLLVQALRLIKDGDYDVVHAGEEAVFIALVIKKLFGIPYVYDMDSSLVQQLTDKMPQIQRIAKPLRDCEGIAVRNADAVIAVCQALETEIAPYNPKKVAIIPDISLLRYEKNQQKDLREIDSLKDQFNIEGELLMYVGNLESYQGIDLLIASFAEALAEAPKAHLVVIGGTEADIQKYQEQAQQLNTSECNVSANVHFIGPRPIAQLQQYLDQADVVVSPRTQGSNTPMKLYSYLDSGKALLATNLTTHTQVLNDQIALTAEPEVSAFAAGMIHLIKHSELRISLGQAAQAYIAKSHTYEAFARKLGSLYDWVKEEISTDSAPLILVEKYRFIDSTSDPHPLAPSPTSR